MEIKRSRPAARYPRLPDLIQRRYLKRIIGGTIVAIGLLSLTFSSMRYGVRLHATGQADTYHELAQETVHAVREPFRIARNILHGLRARPERLTLDFKFDAWQQLVTKHSEAMQTGTLYETDNPIVPAKIRYQKDTVDVDVRLKGGLDHLNSNKWSLRIDVDDKDKTVMGMTTFSLQHPKTRAYLNEWVFHQILKREGIIALRYDFVDVTINGRHLGTYALEQHFAKEVVEQSGRREGVILVLDEELYNLNPWQTPWHNKVRELRPYEEKRVRQDETLTQQVLAARSLVEMFRRQQLSTCEVFDCPLLARYFAILDLLGAQHAAGSGNMKMYFNPVTAHLEPIGFDAEPEERDWPFFLEEWSNYTPMPDSVQWLRDIFSDPEFMSLYIAELYRATDRPFLDSFFTDTAQEHATKAAIIYADDPTYQFNRQYYYDRQQTIRQILDARKALDAYVQAVEAAGITLDVGTVLPFPVEVVGVQYRDRVFPLDPHILPPLKRDQLVQHERLKVISSTPLDLTTFAAEDVRVKYRLVGHPEERLEDVSPFPRLIDDYLQYDAVRQAPNVREFPFVSIDEPNKTIRLSSGNWQIARDLIIPAGYTVTAGSGTALDLIDGAQIISYSPLKFNGSQDNPIVIESSDGQGKGIALLKTGGQSDLRYVIFSNLTGPRAKYWRLTGAVTFYESPVRISSSLFRKNHDSDDALNIVRSPFSLSDTVFENTFADALDVDFSPGTVHRSRVMTAGNDGFDFSGSTVTVTDSLVENSGDKGISAGERSEVTVHDFAVSQSKIGIASKDHSAVTVDGLQLTAVKVGLALYQKKPEFGPAQMTARGVTMHQVEEPQAVERGSTLLLDGQRQPNTADGVAAQLEI